MRTSKNTDKVPRLRFSEFEEPWGEVKIKQILKNYRLGGNYSNSENKNAFPLIKMGNLKRGHFNLDKIEYIDNQDEINSDDIIKEGDLFFNTRNTLDLVGKVAVWRNELPLAYYNSNLMYLKFENNYFMNYIFNSFQGIKSLRRLATGTTSVAAIYTKDLLKLRVKIPSLPEQQKIASFLSTVDKKINLLETKIEHLEQYKKGVVQKIFKQEVRFKIENENGELVDPPDWEEKRLGELTYKVGKKNTGNISFPIYSINNQEGFIPQSEQFEGLDSNDRGYDISMYKIVEKETFAYNPARINVGSIGYSHDLDKVIISSLYVCFKTTEELKDEYLLVFLDTYKFGKYVLRYQEGGVRQYLFYANFSHIKIPKPSKEEQTKIANFLSKLDEKIDLHKSQLENMKTWKKGLLQKMFV